MNLLDLIDKELEAYPGRAVHLAHAARAFHAIRSELYLNSRSSHVDGHHASGE